jgi:FkbM family methyltransferase
MKFFSEYREDAWLHRNYASLIPLAGTYVDVGCAHPVQYSNTAWLRENDFMRWTGLAIDGNPGYAPHWLEKDGALFLACAIGTASDNKFWVEANAACSRVITPAEHADAVKRFGERAADVRVVTLQSQLDHHQIGQIDYLSLDCEGGEFDALSSFDLHRHAPRIIIAEYNTNGVKDFRVRDYLTANGYFVAHQTEANLVYLRKPESTSPRPSPHFAPPTPQNAEREKRPPAPPALHTP